MKLKYVFIVVLLFGTHSCNADYIDDAVLVTKEAFEDGYATTAWGRGVDQDFVNRFLIKYNTPVMTMNISETDISAYHRISFSRIIFLGNEPYDFHCFLTEINILIVNPIKVLLILEEKITEDTKAFTDIAYNNDVGDLTIMSLDKFGSTQLSTYFPFRDGKCGNTEPLVIKPDDDLFPRKFNNFNRCPIRVAAVNFVPYARFKYTNSTVFEIGGFDGRVIKHVIGRMNATIDIVVSQNYSETNTTATDSFETLVENLADVMVPTLLVTMERYETSQVSYVYDTLDLIWCIPKQKEIHQWARVLLPFYNYYTLIIIISFVTFFMSIKLIRKYTKYRQTRSIMFGLYGLFFTQAIKFRTGSWLVNGLLILWIWFSFIVRIAYQGELIEGLGHTLLEPATETVSNALRNADEVVGPESYIEFYRNTSIEERFQSIALSDVEGYVKNISLGKKSMLVLDEMLVRLYGYKVQVLKERVANALACILMRPRWPAAKEVQRLIVQSVEAGLVSKLTSQSRYSWVFKFNSTRAHSKFAPLDMITLSSCFYGLIAMWIACFLILILEIINKKYSHK